MVGRRDDDAVVVKQVEASFAFWRMLLNCNKAALAGRKVNVSDRDASLLTRFFLEEIEAKGFRIVPEVPSAAMVQASRSAMDDARQREAWVHDKTKHKWRLRAAIAAAPEWQSGEQRDRLEADPAG